MPGPFPVKSSNHSYQNKPLKKAYPIYEDQNLRYPIDAQEYMRQMKSKMRTAHNPNSKYDSLKLLSGPNDNQYLDSFMTLPRETKNTKVKPAKKQSNKIGTKDNAKKNNGPVGQPEVSLAMLNSLRSANSDDNIYESVEMIHYLKAKQLLERQTKTRSIQKSGHSLFDHLRVEQALKEGSTRTPSRRNSTVDLMHPAANGSRRELMQRTAHSSPNNSCSSSGDEYETFYKGPSKENRKISLPAMFPSVTRTPARSEQHLAPCDSDDEWAIPRPLFMKEMIMSKRRRQEPSPSSLSGTDESDSSAKSAGSR